MRDITPQGRANPGPGVIIAPSPLLVLGTFLLGVIFDRLKCVRVLPRPWNAVVGTAAFLAGMALFLCGIRRMRAAETRPVHDEEPSRPITDGVFGYSQNPIYLGNCLQGVALSLLYNSAWVLGMLGPVVVHLNRVAPREEAFLEARFGDQFTNYRNTVPRWFRIPTDGGN